MWGAAPKISPVGVYSLNSMARSALWRAPLPAGETLQVWARVSDADQGGYNCGYPTDIWDDEAGGCGYFV